MFKVFHSLLHVGVQWPCHVGVAVEALLRVGAKIFIFALDLLEEVYFHIELLISGVFVAVDLVSHPGFGRRDRLDEHHVEEMLGHCDRRVGKHVRRARCNPPGFHVLS